MRFFSSSHRTWLMALPLSMVLTACDDPSEQAKAPSTEEVVKKLEEKVGATTEKAEPSFSGAVSKPKGPHGAADPHSALGAEKMIKVALQHLAEGREVEAVATLDSAIKKFPLNADLLGVRASLRLQKGRVASALADLENAVRLAPDNPELLVNRSQAYRGFSRTDEALADLDRAVTLAPDMVAARFNRGSIYFAQQKYKDAAADFEHAVAVDPHAAAPYFNLAMAKDSLGDRHGAEADLKRFLELTDSEAWRKAAEDTLKAWAKDAGSGEEKK